MTEEVLGAVKLAVLCFFTGLIGGYVIILGAIFILKKRRK